MTYLPKNESALGEPVMSSGGVALDIMMGLRAPFVRAGRLGVRGGSSGGMSLLPLLCDDRRRTRGLSMSSVVSNKPGSGIGSKMCTIK